MSQEKEESEDKAQIGCKSENLGSSMIQLELISHTVSLSCLESDRQDYPVLGILFGCFR